MGRAAFTLEAGGGKPLEGLSGKNILFSVHLSEILSKRGKGEEPIHHLSLKAEESVCRGDFAGSWWVKWRGEGVG